MRSLAFLALLTVAFPASAQTADDEEGIDPDSLIDEEPPEDLDAPLEKKRDFAFAQPGKTATRTAFNLAGKPKRDYEARVLQGEMEVLLAPNEKGKDDPLLVQRARNSGKGLSTVHVLEYDEPTGRHTLVFRDDFLWYAIYPVRTNETKPAEVARRYGDTPKMSSSRRKVEGAEHTARTHWFPESGVGFAQLDGSETYSYKIIFEPKTRR